MKNGYTHLKEFVSHLRHSNLTNNPSFRSLKGVAPSLPFSDVAFRRYYDHALAYTDFKEASKSEDKHRLYLGLLSGPLYPEAVIYHFRERLLDQVNELCVELGKPIPFKECEVGPLLPPVQGDPFNVDEVICFPFLFFFLYLDDCSYESHFSDEGMEIRKYPQHRKDECTEGSLC